MMFDAILSPGRRSDASRACIATAILALVLLLPGGNLKAQPESSSADQATATPSETNASESTAAETSENTPKSRAKLKLTTKPEDKPKINPELVDWQALAPGEEPKPPKKEIKEIPWSAKVSARLGVDSNIDLFPTGSKITLLGGLGLYAQAVVSPNLRIATLGLFEKNPGKSSPGATEADFFAGYMRELPKNLQLRVSNILSFARERSVFADGTVLLSSTTLQSILENNTAAIVARRQGAFDLEAGTQLNLEGHAGKIEDSRLFGLDAILALRYTYRDRLSFRFRYSYEYSSTTGLSSRNLAGGVDSQNLPLKIGVHRLRTSARARITRDSAVVARFDRVYATDDFSGFLNSHETVAFLGWVAQSRYFTFEGDAQYAKRFFSDRIATIDNPNADTVLSGTARVDFWALVSRRLGLFAMYRYEKASAHPTGVLFERHVALSGITGRLGSTE